MHDSIIHNLFFERTQMNIREASEKEDLDPVLTLLLQASLPTEGVKEHFRHFLVAEDPEGTIIGAIGIELYPDGTGLLRSAVVEPALRNSGIGNPRIAAAKPCSVWSMAAARLLLQLRGQPAPQRGQRGTFMDHLKETVKDLYIFNPHCFGEKGLSLSAKLSSQNSF
jgi:hypothetical protein